MLEVKRKALPKSVRIAVYQKCNGHCVWLKNDKEIEEYSASCLASGAYMYWEDFKDKRLPAHKVFIFEGGDF